MSDEPRPRSRFDRDESDRPPRSRFDRRSRSPASREPESHRTRSPIGRDASDSPSNAEKKAKVTDAAAAAAAAAARINAQIQAKKGIQHVDVPPIRSAISPPAVQSPVSNPGKAVASETYQQDGDYIKDIEINDLRNRYTLTKGAVQKRIKDETGADVTTRGEYYPDKTMATAANPPLYLRVTSTTKEGLDKAVSEIEGLMQQELPNLVDERRFRRREPENFERDEFGRRKWPEEKIPVDLEPINGFNLRAQVVGRGGDNVKYIQQETGCKVQIKGRGSGFMEPQSGRESDDPMYLHIAGPRIEGVQHAKELCEELLQKVRSDYQAHKENVAQGRFGGGGGGSGGGAGDRYSNGRSGYGGDRDRGQGYGHGGYGGQNDHQTPGGAADSNNQAADYNAQWQAYWAQQTQTGEDPYAAWGGYQNYMQYYQWYAQQGQTGTQQQSPPGTTAGAPPPPPSEPAPPGAAAPPPPPPPPPSGSPPGTYNAVPPPPGM